MNSILSYFNKKTHLFILGFILSIGLFFRTYKVIDRLEFALDGDLSSWIVKDMAVDHHLRLVGQLTTAPGIFIGPLYYYLITPFYLLNNMDPAAAIIPITIIGLLTIFSYYFVFSKLFNTKTGLIAAFLYASLLSLAQLDRRVVPSTPSNLWVIWYFYTVLSIARGNFKILPLLGVLIGLIWHIHIALLPTLIAVPAAFFASKKLPTKKQVIGFAVALFIISLPLIIFEARHNFQQTVSLINNFFTKTEGAATGLFKFQQVLGIITGNLNVLLFMPQSFPFLKNVFLVILVTSPAIILLKKGLLSLGELIPLYIWLLGIVAFYSLTSSPVSGYYFANIDVIFLAFASLLFYLIYTHSTAGKYFILILFGVILIKNAYFQVSQNYYHKGYMEKKSLVEYIVQDAKTKNFPCFSINYITSPGENVGFRYFFYLKNAKLAVAGRGSPVYSIVLPDEYARNEVTVKFGHIGVIPPNNVATDEIISEACKGQNTNLTDSMFGYVK